MVIHKYRPENLAQLDLETLAQLGKGTLEKLFTNGYKPRWNECCGGTGHCNPAKCCGEGKCSGEEDPNPFKKGLNGYDFRGWNQPLVTDILNIRKFMKGFKETRDGLRYGYNIDVRQKRFEKEKLTNPWNKNPCNTKPRHHRFFTVEDVEENSIDNKFPDAVLLNYGEGEKFTPLRDYLVQINDDLFLGLAYAAIGNARFSPSYFILERYGEATYQREGIPKR